MKNVISYKLFSKVLPNSATKLTLVDKLKYKSIQTDP